MSDYMPFFSPLGLALDEDAPDAPSHLQERAGEAGDDPSPVDEVLCRRPHRRVLPRELHPLDGHLVPGTKERIGQLEEQRARALRDLVSLDACKLDAEVFADFLQSGTLLDDRSLLDAFVYQALVSEEYVLVTLNYDTKKLEPARINLSRVLTDCAWLPGQDSNLRHAD